MKGVDIVARGIRVKLENSFFEVLVSLEFVLKLGEGLPDFLNFKINITDYLYLFIGIRFDCSMVKEVFQFIEESSEFSGFGFVKGWSSALASSRHIDR